MSFGNPLGFLALLGIPAVVLIHLLQVRSRHVRVSTLFLLEPGSFERKSGRKLDRLRASRLLWMQLAAVVAATWLLVQPRWLREDTTLEVVLVVDGSASMSAYREELDEALASYLPRIERGADQIAWTVLGSDPRAPTLYSGESREAAAAAISEWQSYLGPHDLDESVALASSLAGPRGLVVLLTDHPRDAPPGVEVLSVGRRVDNVGLVSVAIEDGTWRAIVKNSGTRPARRSWWLTADGVSTEPLQLELEPGRVQFLGGELPRDVEALELVLEADRFTLDDRLPFVVPRAKTLDVYVSPDLAENRFVERWVETLAPVELVPRPHADLAIGELGPRASILFADEAPGYLEGPIVAENDPLVEGLDFGGLVVRNASAHAPDENDEDDRALLWQGERPLLALRETGRARALVVGFALEGSNAERIPAFVLALHRFARDVREQKRMLARDNVETRQLLRVASGVVERAPDVPGFFDVRRDGELLFEGAAHFADVREADLSGASAEEPDGDVVRDAAARNSLPDPLSSLWILVLMAMAVYAWVLQERGV